ncbi:uncharacterized protein C8Q71DRAFT_243995 [Rhodofomes roseus]|uniref:Uncharacterized protein n=1 Tax=Rhodofomes roseus TaxID=34475 RepID=A0ABQ8K6P5_9APHY|nr:uncharacterized protein C8Q71DRAFT_243995 [Rhodofomes roseus]KAH9832911.1 hypothetical protein C8Q71DRAFT_243995 [Rhodofomes roseus]
MPLFRRRLLRSPAIHILMSSAATDRQAEYLFGRGMPTLDVSLLRTLAFDYPIRVQQAITPSYMSCCLRDYVTTPTSQNHGNTRTSYFRALVLGPAGCLPITPGDGYSP